MKAISLGSAAGRKPIECTTFESTVLLGSEVWFVPPWPRGSHFRPYEQSSDAAPLVAVSVLLGSEHANFDPLYDCSFLSYPSRLVNDFAGRKKGINSCIIL